MIRREYAEHEPEFDLALATGLRRGSMYRDLMWQNVDLLRRIAVIPKTKNGNSVTVALNADAMRALIIFRSRGDGTGRVVRNAAGEPLNTNAHWFRPAVRAAGIRHLTWHSLRHCFASRLRQKGIDLGTIAELLGHSARSGFAMTKRYSKLSTENLHQAVAVLETTKPQEGPAPVAERQSQPSVN